MNRLMMSAATLALLTTAAHADATLFAVPTPRTPVRGTKRHSR
jgi:hypothetical protein